ncbi:zinc finger protein, putative [Bodo saltans]|uniref:Zinc finger protein, putative n=1 Tax=Bodo saltans TaxID=75058 RepID=A0A0S4IZ24_BODSA|nr:zinc finger protein, putative [Bodo saltans]|eukprot:CUG26694.1 zinc finger protein, putative [Bodo saltans]
MHHPSLLADPTAPATAQLPSSPLSQSDMIPPTVVLGAPRAPPPAFVLANAQRAGAGVIQPAMMRLDDRPIRPSGNGQYNLQFLDHVVDLENYHDRAFRGAGRTWVAPAPEEADTRTRNAQPPLSIEFRQFVQALERPDAMTDAQFLAAFPYERLVELDNTVPASHKGLKPTELERVLSAVVTVMPPHRAPSSSSSSQRSSANNAGQMSSSSLLGASSSVGSGGSHVSASSSSATLTSSSGGSTCVSNEEPFSCAICLSGVIESPSVPRKRSSAASSNAQQSSSSSSPGEIVAPAQLVVVRLICGHLFHHGCIRDWLIGARTCPNCRVDVRQTSTTSTANEAQHGRPTSLVGGRGNSGGRVMERRL